MILDLVRYDPAENLVDAVAIEPSAGTGEFLEPMVRRLSRSCRRQGRPLQDCAGSLQAFEVGPEAAKETWRRTVSALTDCGWGQKESEEIARGWIRRADFLLEPNPYLGELGHGVDFVVGNPPYVRLESIDPEVADRYRKLFRTMKGRADLYVGFYEKALGMLRPGGVCGFVCADRWMLNQYGGNLRSLITSQFGVEVVVEMHDADPFHDEVLAYPAVTVIRRAEQGRALVAKLDRRSGSSATAEIRDVARRIRVGTRSNERTDVQGTSAVVVDEWFKGADPWPCVSPERLGLLKHLESSFPALVLYSPRSTTRTCSVSEKTSYRMLVHTTRPL